MNLTNPAAGRPRPEDAPFRGVVLIIISVLMLVGISACFKYLATSYPPLEIVWARYFFSFIAVLFLFPRRVPRLFSSDHPKLQLLRSLTTVGATVLAIYALRHISIAEVVAITFVAPALTIALVGLVLGERAGPRVWGAVVVGFLGVLIIVRPGAGGIVQWAALLPLLMALCFAVGQLIIRSIGYLEHPVTSLAYQIIVGLLSMTVALPFVWVMPDTWFDLSIFVLSGLLGAGGHYCMIRAFERTAARVVAPFTYVELIWAMVVGFAVFGDVPDLWMVLGAAIVAGSGLFILYQERR